MSIHITLDQLRAIAPKAPADILPFINQLPDTWVINTAQRMAMFLAQTAHESAGFTRLVENLNYSEDGLLKTWPTRFTHSLATAYAREPEKIANLVYANRMGNGPEVTGDGWLYRGRGIIQITGKDNYSRCGTALGIDLVRNPELLEQLEHAVAAAGWYWKVNELNELSDAGNIKAVTQKINGALIGLNERSELHKKSLLALSY